MVTPDYAAYDQDRAQGLVRDLYETLTQAPRRLRSQPTADFSALIRSPRMLSTQSEDGYLLGIPYGRHLKLYYEFEKLGPLQSQLRGLVDDMGELAIKHTDCRLMALEFDDFPNRHHVEHSLVGSYFRDPLAFMLLRCRDMREQDLPDAPHAISVREASAADDGAIIALEERAAADDALAPPLPDRFFDDAKSILVAERDGLLVGYIRLLDADRRGLMAEEFLVDEESAEDAAVALLRETMLRGKADDRRPLTIRVSADVGGDPIFKSFGFKHSGDGLQYLRLAEPGAAYEEVKKRPTYVKVGKIFGRF